jgi:hypothetical protein
MTTIRFVKTQNNVIRVFGSLNSIEHNIRRSFNAEMGDRIRQRCSFGSRHHSAEEWYIELESFSDDVGLQKVTFVRIDGIFEYVMAYTVA